MTHDTLDNAIYTENLLDHATHPRHKGKLAPCTFSHRDRNPSCGDKIDLFVRLGSDAAVEDASFDGYGCAVSQAAASMLMEHLIGKTLAELESADGEIVHSMLGIPIGASRMNCAMLGFKTLKGAIAKFRAEQKR